MKVILNNGSNRIKALKYIKEFLSNGNSLAILLLNVLNLESGRVITFLPEDISGITVEDFKSGGKLPIEAEGNKFETEGGTSWTMQAKPSLKLELIVAIQSFLQSTTNAICILENSLAKASDSNISDMKNVITFRQEVYHYLLNRDISETEIISIINEANSWSFIGVMTFLSEEQTDNSRPRSLDFESLELLAKKTVSIIVSAFDGESYLIWEGNAIF